MSTIIQKTKHLLTSLMLYPIYLILYSIYAVGYKIACMAQEIFTLIYIEQLCGFKRKEKIVNSINAFNKVPQFLVIAYKIDKFIIENTSDSTDHNELEQKILKQHLDILIKVNNLKRITIYIDSQSQFTQNLIQRLQRKIQTTQTQKEISILNPKDIKQERITRLEVPNKSYTPFLIVFSNYEEICNIPSKYLVNAEISFNPELFASTNYQIYKAFAQYAQSKQRNGK